MERLCSINTREERVHLGEFGKRPGDFILQARERKCMEIATRVLMGAQITFIKHYAKFISVWQHGSQSYNVLFTSKWLSRKFNFSDNITIMMKNKPPNIRLNMELK